MIINESARFKKKLAIITHVPHWQDANGEYLAQESYVREIRIWADLFSEIEILALKGEGPMNNHCTHHLKSNIKWKIIDYPQGNNWIDILHRLFRLPNLFIHIFNLIRKCDFTLTRSPGHPGLIGNFLLRIMGLPSLTKWAGEFSYYKGERLPSLIDRVLLNFPSKKNLVLIYGPNSKEHLISFLPALMSNSELEYAHQLSLNKLWNPPLIIISVGRLIPIKNFSLTIKALGKLNKKRPDLLWKFILVGYGPDKERLESLAREEGIIHLVKFTGGLSFSQLRNYYARSHILVMANTKEGWPKVVAEAWAYSIYPLVAPAKLIPWILEKPDSGKLFQPNIDDLVKSLEEILDNPEYYKKISSNLHNYVKDLSLDSFRLRLEEIFTTRFGWK